ncbi:MAG: iron-sulfur cluster assembly scaffold protein [Candidatus Limnocylindria bacterium]
MTKGIGRDANPIDGDKVVIEIAVRVGKVATVEPQGVVVGAMRWVGAVRTMVEFKTAEEARASGLDTFGGCDTARRASLVLHRLAIGRSLEEVLDIRVEDVIRAMGGAPAENGRCVLTVLGALRSAVIDVHVAELAEATVDMHRLRVK